MTTNNDTAVMTEEQLREGLAEFLRLNCQELYGTKLWKRMASEAITYLRAHSPEAAEVELLKEGLNFYKTYAGCQTFHSDFQNANQLREAFDRRGEEVERLKSEIDSETKLHLAHEAKHAALIIGLKDINERLTRELADVSISRDEWQQLAADLKLLVEAQTDLQALEAEFGESHGQ